MIKIKKGKTIDIEKEIFNKEKEIIDKACKWLEEKDRMCMFELSMILGGDFIKDFKKAMRK